MNKIVEKEMVVRGVAYDLNVAKVTLFDVPDIPGRPVNFSGLWQMKKLM